MFERFLMWTEDNGLIGGVVFFAALSAVALAGIVALVALTEILYRGYRLI